MSKEHFQKGFTGVGDVSGGFKLGPPDLGLSGSAGQHTAQFGQQGRQSSGVSADGRVSGGYQLSPIKLGLSGSTGKSSQQSHGSKSTEQNKPQGSVSVGPTGVAGRGSASSDYKAGPVNIGLSGTVPTRRIHLQPEDSPGPGQSHKHKSRSKERGQRPPPPPILYFNICSKLNGLVLDIRGANKSPGSKVITWSKTSPDKDNQLWYEDPSVGTIRSKLHGFCLDISGNVLVVNPYKQGHKNQLWFLSGDRIQSRKDSNKVLDIAGRNTEPGGSVCVSKKSGDRSQLWKFEYQKTGHIPLCVPPKASPNQSVRYFYIRSQMNNKVLDIQKGNPKAGSDVIMQSQASKTVDSQLWYKDENGTIRSKLNKMAIEISGGPAKMEPHYMGNKDQLWTVSGNRIINMGQTDLVLDIKGRRDDDGAPVVADKYSGGVNQHWHLDFI